MSGPMSSEPQGNSAPQDDHELPSDATEGQQEEADVLDRVIEQTMSEIEKYADDVRVLQGVARRFQGQPWTPEPATQGPITVALVEATLTRRFSHLSGDANIWRSVSETISSTLLEDPHARNRLRALWTKLCESLP